MSDSTWKEYDHFVTKAIVELKAHFGQLDFTTGQMRSTHMLADDIRNGVPFLVVQYSTDDFVFGTEIRTELRHNGTTLYHPVYVGKFRVWFRNQTAKQFFAKLTERPEEELKPYYDMNEGQYVTLLYKIRGRDVPDKLKKTLQHERKVEAA